MGLRTALVTGASSGIGRECVRHLAARGFKVFAGVRRQEDADALSREGIPSTVPLILEVTDDASIHAAARAVGALLHANDSFALVSNAGMTVGGPLELIDIAAIRQQFEVNVFGPIAMIQAFLPLLRTHRGRIVLMGSLFGRIALPFVAPYAGAKFALEAFADSLSLELRESGIRVILMEPGNIATPIWGRTKQRIRASVITLPEERLAPYRTALDSFERLTDVYAKSGIPPLRVARTVARALVARRPRNRYPVGWDARIYGRLGPLLPDRIRLWILYHVTLRR